jgi:predicted Na+-dependent transporter
MAIKYAEIGSFVLLYFLVFGMSATVDIRQARKQLRNRNALLTGITLQFVILPFLGFVVVKVLNLDAPMGITLLVVTSSPGGSYSNWYVHDLVVVIALAPCR